VIPLAEAAALVIDACPPLPADRVPCAVALGCVLAESVRAPIAVPPFANSAMDGYAVCAEDLVTASHDAPVRLVVAAEVAAGAVSDVVVTPGAAMRIMTGAPMPAGADAIVMVEHTERAGDDAVLVHASVAVGQHVRAEGDDVQLGDEVLAAGTLLGPAQLGALASVGIVEVLVHPRPRVGVLSTGDELVEPGRALRAGQIYESNRHALLAAVAEQGWVPVDLGLVPDDEAALEWALRSGTERCDVILTSGGVSMGDYDVVKAVLARIANVRWMQIAIRPAKPFALGVLETIGRPMPILGLPGNPVSSLVSFVLLAVPALRSLAGVPSDRLHAPWVTASAAEAMPRRPDGKVHYARVRLDRAADGAWEVSIAGGQGSHQLAALASADALAVLPDGDGVAVGDPVQVVVLRWPGAAHAPVG
jgi:molybdenum cofactor synthesis domain-containing protein